MQQNQTVTFGLYYQNFEIDLSKITLDKIDNFVYNLEKALVWQEKLHDPDGTNKKYGGPYAELSYISKNVEGLKEAIEESRIIVDNNRIKFYKNKQHNSSEIVEFDVTLEIIKFSKNKQHNSSEIVEFDVTLEIISFFEKLREIIATRSD